MLFFQQSTTAQILFSEDCFVGGVTTAGANCLGGYVFNSTSEIKWEDSYELRAAYAITYRYGRPNNHTIFINDTPVEWKPENQIGPEQIETNIESDYFACHIEDISESLVIENNIVSIDLPQQENYAGNGGANWGYWSVHVVILYESPDITEPVCVRLYAANQDQTIGQNYNFQKPQSLSNTPILFSIYSDRLTEFFDDRTRVILSNETVGEIWTWDLFSEARNGVQGTFYYENATCEGLNGDTANTTLYKHDGIAVINEYLTNSPSQNLQLYRVENVSGGGANPHPAFTLTYTPECPIIEASVPRSYRYCRGDSVQLEASGYEYYTWSTAEGLSDSTAAIPICTADSSQWYQVRMWNDDGCSQTIPVHVEVTDLPRPESLVVTPTVCPQFTGTVVAENVPGITPLVFSLNGHNQNHGSFTELEQGTYDLNISTADGCLWDTTVVVDMNVIHQAAFEANPESGFTPLDVFFDNNSSASATSFAWLIDGVYITEETDLYERFDEAGAYYVQLIAYRGQDFCADTAAFTLLVEEGMSMAIPNIITPNGDGMNDVLQAQASGVAHAQWEVYNRWGNMLHSGEASQADSPIILWAPEKGQHPSGVYTVVVNALGNNGKSDTWTVLVTVAN